MKHTKYLLIATLAALSIANMGSASAATTYISGSSAFESVADAALTNFVASHYGSLVAWDNATLGSETNAVLNWGTASNAVTNYIVVHWSGSEAGIQTIDAPTNNPATIPFLPVTAIGLVNPASVSGYPVNASAHIAVANTSVGVSLFHGSPGADGRNYSTPLHDYQVAVGGIAFVASPNWNGLTNITYDQARSLFAAGSLPAAVISGQSVDTNNTVFAVGRNIDAGNRVSTLALLGLGTKGTVVQYIVANSNNIYQAPISTNDGYVNPAIGNDGYPSTGSLLSAVQTVLATSTTIDSSATVYSNAVASVPTPGSNYLIGYLDAKKALGATGITTLRYNGVAPSTAGIENGTYTLWNYVHLMQSRNNTNADAGTIITALKNYITGLSDSQLGAGNAALANMLVQRLNDGGNLSAIYIQP
jgi:hypothetical protein